MNKYLALILILGFFSCDNELDLVEEKTEIPIVYGLISPSDDFQYIRLERAFIDEKISALVIAQDPDSLYYDSAVVTLRNDDTGHTYTAERVDGNLEGFPRDEGVFAQSPNYLYKINTIATPITIRDPYSLNISISELGEQVTSSCIAVENVVLPQFVPGSNVKFKYESTQRLDWTPKVNSIIFDLVLATHFTELDPEGNITEVTVRWPLVKNTQNSDYEFKGEEYFSFLGSNVDDSVSGVLRFFNSMTVEIVSGGQNVADYVSVGQANLGITSSGEIPVFTNLSTGLGLFGSRNTLKKENILFAPESQDSLRNGIYTKHLNFQ